MKLLGLCLITLLAPLLAYAHEPSEKSPVAPGSVVAASVAAYNRQDFEAFATTLHPEVRLYEFPDKLLYKTSAEALAAYRGLFKDASGLRADVSSRVVQGQYVIDQETIYGMPGKGASKGVAVYKVELGKIVAIWFIE